MEWIWLLFAGVLEVTWAVAMKESNGFKVFIPSAITVVGYILSAVFLAMALKKLPIGTSVLGIMVFNEEMTLPQVICIILIVSGLVGLKLLKK